VKSSKDLVGLRFLSSREISDLVKETLSLKKSLAQSSKPKPSLSWRTFVTLFFEPSTRTRVSFEIAIKLMGASAVLITKESSSVQKGETLLDTVLNLQAMGVDGVIMRHPDGGSPAFIAKHLKIPVINAGDGFHEHPTQGLLDLVTMTEKLGSLKNKNVLILGDIAHSRVARSNIWALTKSGANVFVSGPLTLIPADIQKMGVTYVGDLRTIVSKLDVINVLRIQSERQQAGFFPSIREYRHFFGLTRDKLQDAKPELLILHPGPINRGIEIDSEVVDGPQTLILDQVQNGIALRMTVLKHLIEDKT